jgi:hypothetical protein
VSEITAILVAHHAQCIITNYDPEGQIKSLSFEINTPHGIAEIVLPVDPDAVLRVMKKYGSHVPARLQNRQQAIRVAWRIIKDWVSAQCAIIDTEMVKVEQVFLPYVQTQSGQTLFQVFESRNMLTMGNDKRES